MSDALGAATVITRNVSASGLLRHRPVVRSCKTDQAWRRVSRYGGCRPAQRFCSGHRMLRNVSLGVWHPMRVSRGKPVECAKLHLPMRIWDLADAFVFTGFWSC